MDVVRDHIAWMKQEIDALLKAVPHVASQGAETHERLQEIREEIATLRYLISRYKSSGLTETGAEALPRTPAPQVSGRD